MPRGGPPGGGRDGGGAEGAEAGGGVGCRTAGGCEQKHTHIKITPSLSVSIEAAISRDVAINTYRSCFGCNGWRQFTARCGHTATGTGSATASAASLRKGWDAAGKQTATATTTTATATAATTTNGGYKNTTKQTKRQYSCIATSSHHHIITSSAYLFLSSVSIGLDLSTVTVFFNFPFLNPVIPPNRPARDGSDSGNPPPLKSGTSDGGGGGAGADIRFSSLFGLGTEDLTPANQHIAISTTTTTTTHQFTSHRHIVFTRTNAISSSAGRQPISHFAAQTRASRVPSLRNSIK